MNFNRTSRSETTTPQNHACFARSSRAVGAASLIGAIHGARGEPATVFTPCHP